MSAFDHPWDDAPIDVRIWDPAIPRMALLIGALGAVLLGAVGWLVAEGVLPVAGLGQWAAGGVAPAVLTAAAVGLAVGGLIGGTAALWRLPAAPREAAEAHGNVHLLRDGLLAGLLAALGYWILDHLIAWIAHGTPLEPSRYMASILRGRQALTPGHLGNFGVLVWGWLGHLVASLPWGFALAALARWRPRWFAPAPRAVALGALAGAVVWVTNVYIVAPLLGMPWFQQHDTLTMFLVHTPTYGVLAAMWLHHRAR